MDDVVTQSGDRDRRAARLALIAITAIALVAGWAVHRHAWIAAAGTVAILAIGLAWPWLSVRGLRAGVDLGVRRVRVGEAVEIVVPFGNRLPWPLCGITFDVGLAEPIELPAIRPFRARPVAIVVRPTRRGVVDFSRGRVRCTFPFDLVAAERRLDCRGELIVWPARGEGPFPPPRRVAPAATRIDRLAAAIGGDELAGIRPYRAGDPMRHVHWKATARHDRLISRDAHDGPRPPVRIVLDLSAAADDDACERAIARAAGAAEHYLALGFGVEVIVGDRARVVSAAGPRGLERLLDALARLDLLDAPTRATPAAILCAAATFVVVARAAADSTKGAA